MIVQVDHLSAGVSRAHPILSDVSFSIGAGERVALVGPSGAGKTTLVRLLFGLDRPVQRTGGRVLVCGVELGACPKWRVREIRQRHLAFVPQNPASALDPLHTLRWQWDQNLSTIAEGIDRSDAPRFLTAFGISERLSSFPHEWSRGMLQRLLIAMALARKPTLLVMDEPTSALDPVLAAEIMQTTLRHLDSTGAALLLVTHHKGLARAMTNRRLGLRDGRIDSELVSGDAGEVISIAHAEAQSAAPAATPVVEAQSISIKLADRTVVRNMSLKLTAGSAIAVVGESGAGKSTLVRAFLGIVPISSGQLRRDRHLPGFVSQDPLSALHPSMTCADAIGEPLIARGSEPTAVSQRVRDIASTLRLDERHLMLKTQALSIGQAQRACIARAMIANPAFIVFDEPLSALDEETGMEVIKVIKKLRADFGTAMLFVTHDLSFARTVADEIIVLRDGAEIERAPVDTFMRGPMSDYGQTLLLAARSLGDMGAAA